MCNKSPSLATERKHWTQKNGFRLHFVSVCSGIRKDRFLGRAPLSFCPRFFWEKSCNLQLPQTLKCLHSSETCFLSYFVFYLCVRNFHTTAKVISSTKNGEGEASNPPQQCPGEGQSQHAAAQPKGWICFFTFPNSILEMLKIFRPLAFCLIKSHIRFSLAQRPRLPPPSQIHSVSSSGKSTRPSWLVLLFLPPLKFNQILGPAHSNI